MAAFRKTTLKVLSAKYGACPVNVSWHLSVELAPATEAVFKPAPYET